MMWKIVLPFLAALLAVGFCDMPGGLSDISIHDPGFRKALEFAVDQYNIHSNNHHLFKVHLVVRAQVQVVAGMRYVTTVLLAKTICRKDHVHHYCPINSNPGRAESYGCTFSVLELIGKPMSLESQQCQRLQ